MQPSISIFFMKTIHKVAAWFAGVFLLIVLGILISLWTFRQIEEAALVRQHTNTVLNGANNLLSALKDAETSMRGYVITGDQTFLEPYLVVQRNISGQLKALRQITLLVAAQKHLDALRPLVDDKLANMVQAIDLRRKHNTTAALAFVRSGHGEQLMNAIRAEMNSFIQLEEDLLVQREAEFQASLRHLLTFIMVTCLLTLIFALGFAYMLYRETQQRLKNLVHLETLHLLETQKAINDQLLQTNATLQISEEKLTVTLNSIGDAVIATDAEARVTLLNPLAEKLTGWTLV